ncbi:DUF5641 domain-containing protein [Trichonephila clavata]|uniref:DUF5641 domain-containing protein n=1 Tax=Trichonephila clavata TaxID=2740835 RepID=A0A8X6FFI8_TRICU|nr:DUF5641 domain-containing protein [Trichonephila clavata]GFQ81779.1 DUF5641 domain-containing protein [Trichonephila clavata]
MQYWIICAQTVIRKVLRKCVTPLKRIPEPNLCSEKISLCDRWKLLQQMSQSFWRKWSLDYLTQLQQSIKWQKHQPNLKINDLVLIKEDNLPPLKWKLGRVIKVYEGLDGKVRVVNLKTLTSPPLSD